jgi:AraC-like DNA-binding protein
MSPRQLQRALAREGETFSGIVHGVRARLAERYLSTDGTSSTELSQRLGFAAPSAFSRWFRQQFGTTPSDWRRTVVSGRDGRDGDHGVPHDHEGLGDAVEHRAQDDRQP